MNPFKPFQPFNRFAPFKPSRRFQPLERGSFLRRLEPLELTRTRSGGIERFEPFG